MEKGLSVRQARVEIYSCSFCKFVKETLGLEDLEPTDERMYILHLKHSHGLSP